MSDRDSGKPVDIESAALTVYRLYSVGDEIDLDVAEKCLAQSTSRATLSGARQSESIQIAKPPLRVELGQLAGTLGSLSLDGQIRASVYDLGVVVLAWRSPIIGVSSWSTVAEALSAATDLPRPLVERFQSTLRGTARLLRPAISRPLHADVVEDYSAGELAAMTRALIKEEHDGARHIRDLSHQERGIDAGLHSLLLEMMAMDSEKHARLLQFVHNRLVARARQEDGPTD